MCFLPNRSHREQPLEPGRPGSLQVRSRSLRTETVPRLSGAAKRRQREEEDHARAAAGRRGLAVLPLPEFDPAAVRLVVDLVGWHLVYKVGNSFHSRPSSSAPSFFGNRPLHCLKKNGTPDFRHWSRTLFAQSGCIGRKPGPDSPPQITH